VFQHRFQRQQCSTMEVSFNAPVRLRPVYSDPTRPDYYYSRASIGRSKNSQLATAIQLYELSAFRKPKIIESVFVLDSRRLTINFKVNRLDSTPARLSLGSDSVGSRQKVICRDTIVPDSSRVASGRYKFAFRN
jgi:hypothetical protein